MEPLTIKETLKSKLNEGIEPAVDFLYSCYGSMLYGYVLQFIPDNKEAEKMVVLVFGTLAARLQQAFTSPLSVYCWMQVEARKIILEYKKKNQAINSTVQQAISTTNHPHTYYLSLLQDASDEQRFVFSQIFLHGRDKEALAAQLQKHVNDINRLLKESLLIMSEKLP